MRSGLRIGLLPLLVLTTFSWGSAQEELPPQSGKAGKVCVATVGNASTSPAVVERLTQRLISSLKQDKVMALAMESRTTTDPQLHLTVENGEESKDKECDYVLLTQIFGPRSRPDVTSGPQITIGGKTPSVDAADTMSPPVYRENLQINIALFRMGRYKPVLDTRIPAQPSANVSDSFLLAMDREANRVSHELNKK